MYCTLCIVVFGITAFIYQFMNSAIAVVYTVILISFGQSLHFSCISSSACLAVCPVENCSLGIAKPNTLDQNQFSVLKSLKLVFDFGILITGIIGFCMIAGFNIVWNDGH